MYSSKKILTLVGIIFFHPIFAGCAKNEPPAVELPRTTLTEIFFDASVQPNNIPAPTLKLTESTPHTSPYVKVTVVDVEIRFLDTAPVQVELLVRGILPDQCSYNFYSLENRNSHNIKVSLSGIHPADTSCLQTSQNIEYELLLGRDMTEAERGFPRGDYMLVVNNFEIAFSIK